MYTLCATVSTTSTFRVDIDPFPMTSFLYLGETEWAKSGRYTGSTDIELSLEGAAQVSSTAVTLVGAGKLLDPSRLAHIFVSPMKRAKKTFELLVPRSSFSATKVTVTKDITEWNYGDYEGLTTEEIKGLRKERGLDRKRGWNIWRDGCENGEYVVLNSHLLSLFIGLIP